MNNRMTDYGAATFAESRARVLNILAGCDGWGGVQIGIPMRSTQRYIQVIWLSGEKAAVMRFFSAIA
ncbi:hypothetical protein [Pseudomonas viridiflava]|uniref:hypothetical protein n=1 Tax=Pseudomonas viridiflava TaxID=33069 RepID=UPI0013CE4C41|nr:hypothetical protein [Pseudomonas viridiflava]